MVAYGRDVMDAIGEDYWSLSGLGQHGRGRGGSSDIVDVWIDQSWGVENYNGLEGLGAKAKTGIALCNKLSNDVKKYQKKVTTLTKRLTKLQARLSKVQGTTPTPIPNPQTGTTEYHVTPDPTIDLGDSASDLSDSDTSGDSYSLLGDLGDLGKKSKAVKGVRKDKLIARLQKRIATLQSEISRYQALATAAQNNFTACLAASGVPQVTPTPTPTPIPQVIPPPQPTPAPSVLPSQFVPSTGDQFTPTPSYQPPPEGFEEVGMDYLSEGEGAEDGGDEAAVAAVTEPTDMTMMEQPEDATPQMIAETPVEISYADEEAGGFQYGPEDFADSAPTPTFAPQYAQRGGPGAQIFERAIFVNPTIIENPISGEEFSYPAPVQYPEQQDDIFGESFAEESALMGLL